MVSEFKILMMAVYIKEILLMIKLVVSVYFFIPMVIYKKENFSMVSQKDMENIIIKKKLYIMDIGSMIYSMALDMKYGLNHQNILGIIMMGKNME